MSVTIGEWSKIGSGLYRLHFSSSLSSPTFYIYRGGALVGTTTQGHWDFTVTPGEQLTVAVVDDSVTVPETWPSGITIGWHLVPGAAYYRVDEYVSGSWQVRSKVHPDGTGFLKWVSDELTDVTTHRFRVVPVSAGGNEGDALDFNVFFVRVPDVPAVSVAYSAGKIVIS